MQNIAADAIPRDPPWTGLIPAQQVEALHRVSEALRRAGVPSLLGGAFAIGRHVGRWRGTKDVDFFLRPAERERAIEALRACGYEDFYPQQAYDRSWIFRGCCEDGGLVDLIWSIPNHVTDVDDAWFERAARFAIGGREYAAIPVEELIWIKLFVLQRDRCDWPDVINLLRRNPQTIDWERLIARIGEAEPLLAGVLQVLEWLSPNAANEFPAWVRTRFHLSERPQTLHAADEGARAALLDSRPWYAALVPEQDLMGP